MITSGGLLADLDPPTPSASRAVRNTPELRRVRALPTREWEALPRLSAIVHEATRILRTGASIPEELLPRNGGPVPDLLLPQQAVGMVDARRGAFIPLVTGGGKTLLSLLAPRFAGVERAALLLPKSLIKKTIRTATSTAPYWRVPDVLHYWKNGKWRRAALRSPVTCEMWLVNYELLPHHPSMLVDLKLGMVLCDEAHALKDSGSARSKIVRRYRRTHPNVAMSFMSGSFMGRDPREFAHMLKWALGPENAPVPDDWRELYTWACALGSNIDEWEVQAPGALLTLGDAVGEGERDTARKRFAQRLVSTPRVVSARSYLPSCGLTVIERKVEPHEGMTHWLTHLRKCKELPDGEPCVEPLALWSKERQVCAGFWYKYKTPPPQAWRDASRAWAKACFEVLDRSQTLFSILDVVKKCDRGELPAAAEALQEWRGVRGTWKPETVATWWDDAALKLAQEWLARNPRGLCWVAHVEFGTRLAEMTGLPYFREQACDVDGRHIYDYSGPAIVSMETCHEGLDLERWCANLVMSVPTGKKFEQLISRTHRAGQQADEVTCEVVLFTPRDEDLWGQAKHDALCVTSALDQRQRLAIATILEGADTDGNG